VTITVDWMAPARLMERRDDGSDLYFDFAPIGEGSLGALVRDVIARAAGDQQRIVIDAGALGTLNIGQIVQLSERDDFPAD
jgi:hypothetical protein